MATTSADSAAQTGETRHERSWAALIAAIAAVPLLVLAVRVLASHWLSYSDYSAIELRTRAVGTSTTPLIGPFSRYGWSHPGPLLFYALAIPYRALGEHGRGLLIGAVLCNALAIGAVLFVCFRRGRVAGLVIGAVIVLLLARALGAGFFADPWNPYVVLMPTFACALLAWDATETGGRASLPLAIAFGSFAVQSHVGVALAVLVPIVLAVVLLAVERRSRELARTFLIALAVLLVCWLAPIVDELHSSGNISSLVKFWTQSHAHTTGWSTSARFVSAQLDIWPPWISGHESRDIFSGGLDATWHVPYALMLLVGATVVALLRRDRESARLCAFSYALILAGFVSSARIVDVPFTYVIRWLWIVGAFTWLAIAWTAMRTLQTTHVRTVRAFQLAGAAAVAALVVVLTVSAGRTHLVDINGDERALSAIAPGALAAMRPLPQPLLVYPAADLYSSTMTSAFATLAIDAGIDARVPTIFTRAVGKQHTIGIGEQASEVIVAVGNAAQKYENDGRYRVLANYVSPDTRPSIELFLVVG